MNEIHFCLMFILDVEKMEENREKENKKEK